MVSSVATGVAVAATASSANVDNLAQHLYAMLLRICNAFMQHLLGQLVVFIIGDVIAVVFPCLLWFFCWVFWGGNVFERYKSIWRRAVEGCMQKCGTKGDTTNTGGSWEESS